MSQGSLITVHSAWCRAPFLLAIIALTGPAGLRADEPHYTLDEVITRLKDWEAKIVTLRMKARIVCDPQSTSAKDSGLAGAERIGFCDFIWTDTGAARIHRWTTLDGKVSDRSLDVDGIEKAWKATYQNGQSEESIPSGVQLRSPQQSQAPSLATVPLTPLIFLWQPVRHNQWLGRRLERGEYALIETAMHHGRKCVLLRRDNNPTLDVVWEVWLDAEHGFLPIEVGVGTGQPFEKYSVDEFHEPEPGFFFPKRGRFIQRGKGGAVIDTEHWEIEFIELNQPIPDSLWQPPFADGTDVIDMATSTHYVHGGGKSFAAKTAARIAEAAKENMAPKASGQPVRAQPSGGSSMRWPAGLLALAVALLSGAIWRWRAAR